MDSDVLNLAQLAEHLQMSQASVYHLVAKGKIPGTKVGKQWRFSRQAIRVWLQGTERSSAAVLVVDDDGLIRNLLLSALRDAGHQCTEADSVASAVAVLREFEFDTVFLDLLLQDGTGLDIVRSLVQLDQSPEVVVVTAHPGHEAVCAIRQLLPQVNVLPKPVRLAKIIESVKLAETSPHDLPTGKTLRPNGRGTAAGRDPSYG